MKKKFKKAFIFCYSKSKDCFEIIFQGSAENHIRLQKEGQKKFTSYYHLKKYQKHLRKVSLLVLLAVTFLFIGVLFSPVFLKEQMTHEIYIPDGKGDILLGNISKNQATVVFKTFDMKNNNAPLATTAVVEVYLDKDFKIFYKKTDTFEFAVTHIIPIHGLREGQTYYVKIVASEDRNMKNSKEISNWAGSEPISFFTTGEIASDCEFQAIHNIDVAEKAVDQRNLSDKSLEVIYPESSNRTEDFIQDENEKFEISGIQNENYLHGKDKVQTIIYWNTNKLADSTLLYRGEKDDEDIEIESSNGDAKKHAIILTTLKPESVYYYRVKSVSQNGEVAVSSQYSMRTPRPKQTILEIVGGNFKTIIKQIGI